MLARARRAAQGRHEDAARTLLKMQEEQATEANQPKGSSQANAARRAVMPEREANADAARRAGAERCAQRVDRAEAEAKEAAWRLAEVQA